MNTPVYDDRTARLLATSRQRADATEREARTNATRCGWCGDALTPGERCTKPMCQCEAMGDAPSDYR